MAVSQLCFFARQCHAYIAQHVCFTADWCWAGELVGFKKFAMYYFFCVNGAALTYSRWQEAFLFSGDSFVFIIEVQHQNNCKL